MDFKVVRASVATMMTAALALLTLASGCSSAEAGSEGARCDVDKDCKESRVCKGGECTSRPTSSAGSTSGGNGDSGGSCSETGAPCTANSSCCNYQNDSGLCVDFGQGGRCADSCSVGSECTSGCCAATSEGNHICSAASFCVEKGIGEPCSSGAECTSALCTGDGGPGWCTQLCSSSSDCGSGGCVRNNASTSSCFPRCSSDSDCAVYGIAGIHCRAVSTVDGDIESVCST